MRIKQTTVRRLALLIAAGAVSVIPMIAASGVASADPGFGWGLPGPGVGGWGGPASGVGVLPGPGAGGVGGPASGAGVLPGLGFGGPGVF
jgi:hypothetical protein